MRPFRLRSSALCTAVLVSACGGDGDSSPVDAATAQATFSHSRPTVTVDDLETGAYVVLIADADADAPAVGKYYAGEDGTRLLIVSDTADRARQVYRREPAPESAWTAVPPADAEVTVHLLSSHADPLPAPELDALAGTYVAPIGAGQFVTFEVTSDGGIQGRSGTGCRIAGELASGTLPSTMSVRLQATDCADLPASSEGVLVVDRDYVPARFRLVTDDASRLVDLWAYAE